MAEQQENTQGPGANNSFTGGMNKDGLDVYSKGVQWSLAVNATNNLVDGQYPSLSTEMANILELILPYTLIGGIALAGSEWAVFCTDNTISEIGLYNEATASYSTLLNDSATIAAGLPGMNFNTSKLIIGTSRRGFDCGYMVYWADGRRNPDRVLDTAFLFPNPWVQSCTTSSGCVTCVNTNLIDVNQLRLAPHFSIPCLTLAKGQSGTLLNGSYQVAIRFAINSIPCTDFIALSNTQSIFAHNNLAGSVVLTIAGIDEETRKVFTEMEVVIVSTVNQQVVARRFGIYSTSQTTIYIDHIDQELTVVPLSLLPLNTPAIESSDAIYSVGTYLTRVGPSEKPDFNYQPLANNIIAKWACIEYPGDYYHKGGILGFPMNVSYLRGEVYALYIRWIDTCGNKSACYAIPGLPAGTPPTLILGGGTLPDGGVIVATGRFEGYSSTEIYDDHHPLVWGSLCGQPIMHHKFPDQTSFGGTILSHFTQPFANISGTGTTNNIRIMGLFVENVQLPLDINGNVIQDIQGYEILRAVRNGHKSIIAKGMVNSMRGYDDPYTGKKGAFQNYPYNDQSPDYYLTSDVNIINTGSPNTASNQNHNTDSPLTTVYNNIVSFHSPDTAFQHPILGTGSLRVVQRMTGEATGYFQQAYRHGNFKTITDFSSWLGNTIGIISFIMDGLATANAVLGGNPPDITMAATEDIPFTFPLFFANTYSADIAGSDASSALKIIAAAANVVMFLLLSPIKFAALQEQILTIITGLAPARAFAWQWNSSGQYNNPGQAISPIVLGVQDYQYIKGHIQDFAGMTINNLWRNSYVGIQLYGSLPPISGDTTRKTMFQRGIRPQDNDSVMGPYTDPTSAYYAAYTVPQPAQYGQIDSCKLVPISCMNVVGASTSFYNSPILFGGDTYICRYTEKNPMYFFNDWLIDAPLDYMYNYRNYVNVPYPRYWIDNTKIHTDFLAIAHKLRHLDAQVNGGSLLGIPIGTYVKNGAFYLFCNGVRDFYCESDVNVGYRDWEDTIPKMFYDPYGFQDISQMFRSDYIKNDIFYKYDYSLSASQFFNQYISWGQMLPRDYDPLLAYTCFAYYPRRVAYSLPQEEEVKKDNWRVFLPNNYKDFGSTVTAIKEINKTGALILLNNEAPQQFVGTEVIASSSSTEYTVGTGNLFNQSLASVSNADNSLQYGSCQSRLSVVNTPHGLFWVSQNTGKVFNYGQGGMSDITPGLKWHLSLYLPSQLLSIYPNYPLSDNPVAGVGVQCIYDNINEMLYICKKDYKPLDSLSGVLYNDIDGFYTVSPYCPPGYVLSSDGTMCNSILATGGSVEVQGNKLPISLNDPLYFEDVSFTLSYDCKAKQWISFHDWHPSLNIPAKTHFLTTQDKALYRHNKDSGLYCNYYGQDYSFQIEYPITTGLNITTLESITVFLETYNYKSTQVDRFQQYDGFFDEVVVHNSEQCTAKMLLNLKPWNDPYAALNFPNTVAAGLNVLYTKQEQTYKIGSGLRDLTKDRGQFTLTQVQAITTSGNGYIQNINPLYLDPLKPFDQLKKIRHYKSKAWFKKRIPGNNAMIFYFSKTQNTISPR